MDRSYILSENATVDIADIYDYTLSNFGYRQAENYLLKIHDILQLIGSNPELGIERQEVVDGLLSFVMRSHIVFYTVASSHKIRVLRILHGNQDIDEQFRS